MRKRYLRNLRNLRSLLRGCPGIAGVVTLLMMTPAALAQQRPYIGFVYPAGGQQGTTIEVRLGGQAIDNPERVFISGEGVSARVVEYRRRLGAQETQLLREQLRTLKRARPKQGEADEAPGELAAKIEQRIAEQVARPACAAIASIVIVEVTVAADAAPGRRELTLTTMRGVSNPLAFHIGQLPEVLRKPMTTAPFQVLGKERLALRRRPDDEVEQRIALPCTVNGQIASGEVNRYRFAARKGQRLVIAATARELNPFVADAVPGWFQPVMALHDADGVEVAYSDDYRFKPDPVILCEVPRDGEYVLTVSDALYRGREDFVYRVSIGELPFVTGIFPLGGRAGEAGNVQLQGWNLERAKLVAPAPDSGPGVWTVAAKRTGLVSNVVPFELGTLPEAFEQETNDEPAQAQKTALPVVINGRIDRRNDWDVFAFTGTAGQSIVAEVDARRLESPLDSFVKVTDAAGAVLAFNDDQEDPEAGMNTHDADSYIMLRLPADGTYYVHLSDTARAGGESYGYRLRISEARPDFALRMVPTSVSLRSRGTAVVTVQAIRRDGFNGPIQLALKNPPAEFSAARVSIGAGQQQARVVLRTTAAATEQPVSLQIEGSAKIGEQVVTRMAVPAEDRMQAFLWRHLVPAQELKALVYDPAYEPPPGRVARLAPPATSPATRPAAAGNPATAKPKFTKQQVASRLRQLKILFEDGLITEEFYGEKVRECEEGL